MKKIIYKIFLLLFSLIFIIYVGNYFIDYIKYLKNENLELQQKVNGHTIKEKKINCMTKTLVLTYNLSTWEAHYYSIIFNDFSENYKIPWEIYPAIIRIESNFKVSLISSKAAKGLMQIIEPTAKTEAEILKINYEESQTLWNEICNLVIGCNYLSRMILEKGLEGGVKSYLGGPSYLVTIKKHKDKRQYVSEYKSSVWKEFKQLNYIYRGVISESGYEYKEIHPFQDTTIISVKLFDLKDVLTGKNY